MKKIIVFLLFAASVMTLSSCADAYMVETVYDKPYYIWYQEPYSRVIISSVPSKYPPRHYGHRPHVEYRHYQPHHHAMPPSRPMPPSNKPHNNNHHGRR